MNSRITSVSGTFHVVSVVADDRLDQLAAVLQLDADEKAKLKASGSVIVVLGHGAASVPLKQP